MLLMAIDLKYEEMEYKRQTEQRYVTKLFNAHVSTALFQFESILELISYDPTLQKDLNDSVIDNILSRNPLLLGFALFSPDGEAQTVSSTIQHVLFPNLLNDENTQLWFKQALSRDQMTVGRPYFLQAIKKWIIPVRKRIVDKQGNITGVIAAGLDLQALSLEWNDGSNGRRVLQAILAHGRYRLIRTNVARNKYQQYYAEPLGEESVHQIEKKLALQGLSLEALRQSEQIAQFQAHYRQDLYITLQYNKKHQIWISTTESDYLLQQELVPYAVIYSACYLVFLITIFLLFKWIVRIEKMKITQLTYRAEHDLLTGLYNRSILQTNKLTYRKNKQPYSLLYIDLDHFKTINDSYGYSYGDAVLVEVSKRIIEQLSPFGGTPIRLNADEFIIFIELADKEQLEHFCQRLLEELCRPCIVHNNDFKISASIGIAQSPSDAKEIETLVTYANNSMLIAKKAKNHYIFFSEEIRLQLIKNLQIEQALHNALSRNEVNIAYQPQLDNQGRLHGVEALARWSNGLLGVISPKYFIPIAEEIGLMPEIGSYIMNQAMSEIATLQFTKKKAFQLSINVSARQFAQLNFSEALFECLSCYKSSYLGVTVEITESLFIENVERLAPIFERMKQEGLTISLDDFGTGYSSLSMIRNMPIDELKIDKSFVNHIASDKGDRAMVESIVTMGKNMGMNVLAEGIENPEQAKILQQAGCDFYQGYYFSKPLSLQELNDFIDALESKERMI